MRNGNHRPATLAELRAELKAALKPYVTRRVLEQILRRYVTKSDLKKALSRCATKEDLDAAIAKCATKEDLDRRIRPLVLAIGRLQDDVAAMREQMPTKNQLDNYQSLVEKVAVDHEALWKKHLLHDERLRVLEERCPPPPTPSAAPQPSPTGNGGTSS